MKKMKMILTAILVCAMFVCPVSAEEHPDRLVDLADLVDAEAEQELRETFDEISERLQFDVAVLTVESMDGESAQDFADDYYDENGYGIGEDYDGALLVISMEEREWYISTCGYGIVAIPDYEIDYIGEEMIPYLSDGDYANAFWTYASLCEDLVTYAEDEGIVYDEEVIFEQIEEMEEEPGMMDYVIRGLICLVVGFVAAFIPMLIMKSKMKTVVAKEAAGDYLVSGSRNLTVTRDQFLYHTINRTAKPKNTSSSSGGGGGVHMSSGGRAHGGGGGKF